MEKPANLIRVCNDRDSQGVIKRGNRPEDRRYVMISLTDAGRTSIEQVMSEVLARTTQAYDAYDLENIRIQEQLFMR